MSIELVSSLDRDEMDGSEMERQSPSREKVYALCIDCDAQDAGHVSRIAARSKQLEIDLSVCYTLAEAVALLQTRRFDVIYVEYWLGEETSVPFICACAASDGAPCVVLTGLDEPDIRRIAFRAGAQGFLSKNELSPQALESVTLSVLFSCWKSARVA